MKDNIKKLKWDKYQESYNNFVKILESKEIDVKLLEDLKNQYSELKDMGIKD